MDVFVARQPILDRKKRLYGYELLFRTGTSNAFPQTPGDVATSSLLSSAFFSSGIDRISGSRRAFINFTEALLLQGTPSMFPREKIMVEILEDIRPSQAVVDACRSLKTKGYYLALDDFEFTEEHRPLLDLADVVKFDFQKNSGSEIIQMIGHIRPRPCKLLAEKIETYEDFTTAVQMGFDYFQGYFFARPEVLKNKDIPPAKLTVMKLISEIHETAFNVEALERIISRDVAISYKLLKYLNSAYYSRLAPLTSIRQAIAYLGERGVRLFVSLIAASQLAENKPGELSKLAMIRARFLEHLGAHLGLNSAELFLMGLFSLIDAMLDNPMDYLVGQLPVSGSVADALVHRSGAFFPCLELVESFERADWQRLEAGQRNLGLESDRLEEFYLDAIRFAEYY